MWTRKHSKKQVLTLQCEWQVCRFVSDSLECFYKHLEEHFNLLNIDTSENQDLNVNFPCHWQECTYSSSSALQLRRHIFFHGFHTKVKWLGYMLHQKKKLAECQIHQNRNVIPELPTGFQCCWEGCYVVFDVPDQFYFHVGEHALMAEVEDMNEKKVYKCHWEGCNYYYEGETASAARKKSMCRSKLKHHMSSHTQERLFACTWCGNLYINGTKLEDHYTRQTDVESHSFQCTYCSRTYPSERLLKDHMRHHVNHYKCPNCEMTCPNPSSLKHHIRYKHSEDRPYPCSFCEYRSKEPYDLQVHMAFHQSTLSFVCQVDGCDYAVRSIQNLQAHYRGKHGNGNAKVYACHICDKRHFFGYQLSHHLRKVHNYEWPPGHSRFRYKEDEDNLFRLQTFRYETTNLVKDVKITNTSENLTELVPVVSKAKKSEVQKPSVRKSKRKVVSGLNSKSKKSERIANQANRNSAKHNRKHGKQKTNKSPKQSTKAKRKAGSPATQLKIRNKDVFQRNKSIENLQPGKSYESDSLLAADVLCNMKNSTFARSSGSDIDLQTSTSTLSPSILQDSMSNQLPALPDLDRFSSEESLQGSATKLTRKNFRRNRLKTGSARKRLLLDKVLSPPKLQKVVTSTKTSLGPVFSNLYTQPLPVSSNKTPTHGSSGTLPKSSRMQLFSPTTIINLKERKFPDNIKQFEENFEKQLEMEFNNDLKYDSVFTSDDENFLNSKSKSKSSLGNTMSPIRASLVPTSSSFVLNNI